MAARLVAFREEDAKAEGEMERSRSQHAHRLDRSFAQPQDDRLASFVPSNMAVTLATALLSVATISMMNKNEPAVVTAEARGAEDRSARWSLSVACLRWCVGWSRAGL